MYTRKLFYLTYMQSKKKDILSVENKNGRVHLG